MAWEWVAPAATAVVALAGIAGTYLASGRQHRVLVAAAAQDLEWKELVLSYDRLLEHLSRLDAWPAEWHDELERLRTSGVTTHRAERSKPRPVRHGRHSASHS